MTTPEARPEAVAVTEAMVGPSFWLEHRANGSYLVRRSGDVSACLAMLSKEEAAALEAAAQVRSAQDHGGEANEMFGEPRSGRMAWHLKQAEDRATAAEARAAKAVEVLREIERGDPWGQCPYCGGHPHAKSCELATLLSDHPALNIPSDL